MLGLDALGSAAYGPEAALTLLLPLGFAAISHIGPISTLIILLLAVVYFSYRQTISAYPHGGGSYTVAKENLGTTPGLFAAAALSARLRAGGGRRDFGGSRCAGLGAAGSSASHACRVPSHSGGDHADQSARRARVGDRIRDSHVPVHRFACWAFSPSA